MNEREIRERLARLCNAVIWTYVTRDANTDWESVFDLAADIEADLAHEDENVAAINAD